MHWLVGVDDWLASYCYGTTEKTELDPISTEEQLRQLLAIYGCSGTEFSYVIFTEQWSFTMAKRQRKNCNGMLETGHNTVLDRGPSHLTEEEILGLEPPCVERK